MLRTLLLAWGTLLKAIAALLLSFSARLSEWLARPLPDALVVMLAWAAFLLAPGTVHASPIILLLRHPGPVYASIGSALESGAGTFLFDHPSLIVGPICLLLAWIYSKAQAGDAADLAKIEALPLFVAHPDLAPLLSRGNALVMSALKTAYAVTTSDLKGASALNPALADKIGADVLSQLRAEFGLTAVAAASAQAGGEAQLVQHFSSTAGVFIAAPVATSTLRTAGSIAAPSTP